jgi:hypothetical protein
MASTCSIYKHGIKMGDGSCAAGSASITSFTKVAETGSRNRECVRRNVQITVTEAGTHTGRSWNARVLTDNGAGTLTLSEPCPYVGA